MFPTEKVLILQNKSHGKHSKCGFCCIRINKYKYISEELHFIEIMEKKIQGRNVLKTVVDFPVFIGGFPKLKQI